ncbi:hypothetical protein ACHAWO_003625 [Cyclotella atomus]|uniref:Uncharacterized protein n=1 Tax=Cyclotella atomus TaxID=382360 RepID=A0ABD3NM35_9STRA
MKSVCLLALAGSAAAFAPAQQGKASTALNYASELDSMPTSVECPKVFDPLGLSDYVPVDWARRAELSNGRSAMLATVGWFFPKDQAARDDLKMKELKNARLAMIGFAGFMANHFIPGSCPVPDFIA